MGDRGRRLGKLLVSFFPVVVAAAGVACGGTNPGPGGGAPVLASLGARSPHEAGRIEVHELDARPRLTLVSRDGDLAPAIVAVVATDLGPAPTTALAAVVEARLVAKGFAVDGRVDRGAFRVRSSPADAARAQAFFLALADAFSRPITEASPELSLARARLTALARHPLDAAELVPVAACTGTLGLAPGEGVPDLRAPGAVRALDAQRAGALHTGRASIAAVGPASFGRAVAAALKESEGWPAGPAVTDAWPAADALGVYTSASLDRGRGRVTIAVRVADPQAAAAAAERLGAKGSPLVERLSSMSMPQPFRLVEVAGVARPRGGCLEATIESAGAIEGEAQAAYAAALLRHEMRVELGAATVASVAGRQILGAADPREAAARAAWWALSAPAEGAPERWATALGIAPAERAAPGAGLSLERFRAELGRAIAASDAKVVEQRAAVERGQGELWALVGTPCGVAEEDDAQAGLSALAVLAAIEGTKDGEGVTLEPWITADGLGVIAHAQPRDERETPAELARRVTGAAARAIAATSLTGEAAAAAKSSTLELLERTNGRESAAIGVLSAQLAPDHPSWVEPLGLWNRVTQSGIETIRLRRRELAASPLRLAVIANEDAAQIAAAAAATDRWLVPSTAPRVCRAGAPVPARPGRYEAHLPSDARIAQGLIAAPLAASSRTLAELFALHLGDAGGALSAALQPLGARAAARLVGGARAPALLIDLRAPEADLAGAIAAVKALFERLPGTLTDADLARAQAALDRREQEARTHPRGRLIRLFAGAAPRPDRPTLAAWRTFLEGTLKEGALIVVEARPE